MFEGVAIGLCDKNGTPIREGDMLIVNAIGVTFRISEEDGFGIVKYDNRNAKFIVSFGKVGFKTDYDHLFGRECEIIGSVYDKNHCPKCDADW